VYGVKPSHVRGPYQSDLRTSGSSQRSTNIEWAGNQTNAGDIGNRGAEASRRIGDPICNLSRLNADGRIGHGGHVLATLIRRSIRSGGAIRPPEEW
jgi:hypothetical protein